MAADRIIKAPGFVPVAVQTRLARYALEGKLSMGFFFELLSFPSPSLQSSGRSCQDVPHAAWKETQTNGAVNVAPTRSRAASSLVMRQERCPEEAAGCFPGTSQGGVSLGAFPSLWLPAMGAQKPDFAGSPGRGPSVGSSDEETKVQTARGRTAVWNGAAGGVLLTLCLPQGAVLPGRQVVIGECPANLEPSLKLGEPLEYLMAPGSPSEGGSRSRRAMSLVRAAPLWAGLFEPWTFPRPRPTNSSGAQPPSPGRAPAR